MRRAMLALDAIDAEMAAARVDGRLGRGGEARRARASADHVVGVVLDPDARGAERRMTGVGWLTARRRGPGALARLGVDEPLVRAAEGYLAAAEALGASGPGEADGPRGGGISDGGAVTRVAAAERWRAMRQAMAWVEPGEPAGALGMGRLEIVDAVVLGGCSLSAVVEMAGRAPKGAARRAVGEQLVLALDRLARWRSPAPLGG